MPGEHELQIALATALRERDEARSRAADVQSANLGLVHRMEEERAAHGAAEAALAAARRECEGLRKRVREVRADMTPTNMQYEAHFLRQWIVSWAKKLDAALAAPAAGDSK